MLNPSTGRTPTKSTIRTVSRRLENFLYAHGIMYLHYQYDPDGVIYWVYADTPEVRRIVSEFRSTFVKKGDRTKNALPSP